jgi:DNA-directed RNA polymerase subunit M/transcription elongation factor TFIIS
MSSKKPNRKRTFTGSSATPCGDDIASIKSANAKRVRNTKKNPLLLSNAQPLSSFGGNTPSLAQIGSSSVSSATFFNEWIIKEDWDKMREGIIQELTEKIQSHHLLDDIDRVNLLSEKIEHGIQLKAKHYSFFLQENAWMNSKFRYLYLSIADYLSQQLCQQKYILERLVSGEIDPQDLAFLSPAELDPIHWGPMLENYSLISKLSENDTAMQLTTHVKCSRCKQNEVWYYESQTRSADEPMTTFYRCKHCRHRWKS